VQARAAEFAMDVRLREAVGNDNPADRRQSSAESRIGAMKFEDEQDGWCGHEVSGIVASSTPINSITSRRPSLQIGQRSESSLTSTLSPSE
jgi:hypothetical protein